MDEKNELSDIVLNKGGSSNSNKKIILAIATLGVVLIVVVMLMNSINSKGTDNLPQAVLPPEPQTQASTEKELDKEPLFEDVPIVQENSQEESNLDHIAKKLKEESAETTVETIEEPAPAPIVVKKEKRPQPKAKVAKTTAKKVTKTHVKQAAKQTVATHAYFVQVGSFSKYTPNKKFLNSITNLGYHYSYRKIKNINKVLVGPFKSRSEANKAKAILRKKVVSGAFLVKL